MSIKKISLLLAATTFICVAGCSQKTEEEKRVEGEKEYTTAVKYLTGMDNTTQNKDKAVKHLEKAYNLGNAKAGILLAMEYIHNPKKRDQGISILKQLADSGDGDAMRLYAFASYYNADGTPNFSNFEESNKYMLMSIEKGEDQALIEYPSFLYHSNHKEMIIPFLKQNKEKYTEKYFLVDGLHDWILLIEEDDPNFTEEIYREIDFLNKKIEDKKPDFVEKHEEGESS